MRAELDLCSVTRSSLVSLEVHAFVGLRKRCTLSVRGRSARPTSVLHCVTTSVRGPTLPSLCVKPDGAQPCADNGPRVMTACSSLAMQSRGGCACEPLGGACLSPPTCVRGPRPNLLSGVVTDHVRSLYCRVRCNRFVLSAFANNLIDSIGYTL